MLSTRFPRSKLSELSKPKGGASRRSLAKLAAQACVQMMGLGRPVVPEVCRTTKGSPRACSNVFSKG